jgi:hypothetical protein
MTQRDYGTIDPNTKSGTDLATNLNDFRDAQNTQHAGTSTPSYVQAGMIWADNTTTSLIIYMYDGTDSIPIFQIDATNNIVRSTMDADLDSYLTFLTDDVLSIVLAGTGYTINAARAAIMAALDQALATTSNVTFAQVTVNGNVIVTGTVDGRDIAADGLVTDDAVLNADATTASMSFVIDEDSFASDLATKVPTQQSTKAYVDTTVAAAIVGVWDDQGGYNASTNSPDLDSSPSGSIVQGWLYTVTAAGVFFSANVEIGDVITAKQDAPTTEAHWTIVQKNLDAASIKVAYESNADTNEFNDAEKTKVAASITGVSDDTTPQSGGPHDMNSFALFQDKGVDVASATELLVLTDGNSFDVTGTTTIATIENTADAFPVGAIIRLQFDGILTLTHHATNLILVGAANIITAAGDSGEFEKIAAGDWRCNRYTIAANAPGGGISNVVEDTTPQLGGDLDFQTFKATTFESTGIDDNATETAIVISANEEVTMPLQPAFLASPSSHQSMLVSTVTDIVLADEDIDQASNFSANTFTAPVAGLYLLKAKLRINTLDYNAAFYELRIVTNVRTYYSTFDPDFGQNATFWALEISSLADMDAGDTAKLTYFQSGGTAVSTIDEQSYFSGYLVA